MSASKDKLTRQILMGLAAGAVATCAVTGTASATTLTEYKAELSKPASSPVIKTDIQQTDGFKKHTIDSAGGNAEYRNEGVTLTFVTVKPDTVLDNAVIRTTNYSPNEDGSYTDHLSSMGIYIGVAENDSWADWQANNLTIPNNNGEVDLTNTVLAAECGSIDTLNGTVLVKAENLYGGDGVGKICIGGDNGLQPGYSLTELLFHNISGTSTLKLVGNTNFNNNIRLLPGTISASKNFIEISSRGVLEAESVQLFNTGLGIDGTVANPNGIMDT